MKKENKKLAQEMRAKQRAKDAQRAKVKSMAKIWAPIVGAVLVLIVVIVAVATSGGGTGAPAADNAGSGNTTVENDAEPEDASADDNQEPVSADGEDPALDTTEGVVIQNGDHINLDYVGTIDGVEFEGGNTMGMGTDLLIGSGSYIDGFEEGIIGHAVGETFDLNLTFPENYHEELAGKDVVFRTTVNGIYKQ